MSLRAVITLTRIERKIVEFRFDQFAVVEFHAGDAQPLVADAVGEAGGRLVAARLRLEGACPVHGRLRAAREQVTNECRSLAGIAGVSS